MDEFRRLQAAHAQLERRVSDLQIDLTVTSRRLSDAQSALKKLWIEALTTAKRALAATDAAAIGSMQAASAVRQALSVSAIAIAEVSGKAAVALAAAAVASASAATDAGNAATLAADAEPETRASAEALAAATGAKLEAKLAFDRATEAVKVAGDVIELLRVAKAGQ